MRASALSNPAGLGAAISIALLLSACAAATRPVEPSRGEPHRVPDGAIALRQNELPSDISFGHTLEQTLDHRFAGNLERDARGRPVFRVLAISGGGSRGAYGAGVLEGWTATGTRPDFEVVTGISTGALIATFAFLGPEYDDSLRVYTRITNDDIYVTRGRLAALTADALRDTAPLRDLIASQIDAEVLDAVARAHVEQGRRLFVGTTNLDANAFTMWDMGAIAASDSPDKLERYRDIVLASASFPMMFPPVYLPVELDDGETRWQMHVDGSARSAVFASTFMLDLDDAIERWGLGPDDVPGEIWVIHNGRPNPGINNPVAPRVTAIAGASIRALLEASSTSSLWALYALAMVNGFEFSYTAIPRDFDLGPDALDFDRAEMSALFQLGRSAALSGRAWRSQPPPSDALEVLQIIDPSLRLFTGENFAELPRRPPRWMRDTTPLENRTTLSLCTDEPGTYYDAIGAEIRRQVEPFRLTVQFVPTTGSVENLRRLRDGSCNAALAQNDVYLMQLIEMPTSAERLDVMRPKYMFEEFVFLVCHRESGVRRIGELREQSKRHRILIGPPGSGSTVTWKVFTRLNSEYEAIPTQTIGGRAALETVAGDDVSACILHTSTLDSPFLHALDEAGKSLRLISVDDWAFNDAEFAGERVYAHGHVPVDTYPNLLAGLVETGLHQGPVLETLTVGSSLFVAKRWAERHPQAYGLLLDAASQTRSELLKPLELRRAMRRGAP